MNNIRKQSGFTLIELMIVIAILAILMAIAIPAYQNYTIRTRVSECLNATAPAKLAVSETRISSGEMPDTNNEAGWAGFTSGFCTSINVGGTGVITVTANSAGVGANGAIVMRLVPTTDANDNVVWECDDLGTQAGNQRYIPSECRG